MPPTSTPPTHAPCGSRAREQAAAHGAASAKFTSKPAKRGAPKRGAGRGDTSKPAKFDPPPAKFTSKPAKFDPPPAKFTSKRANSAAISAPARARAGDAAQAKACAAKLIHKMAAAAKIAASFRQIAPICTPLRQQYARRRPPLCRRAGKAQKKPASGRANFSTAAEGRGRRSFWVREESPPAGERFNFPFFCGGRGGRSCRRRCGSCAPLCRRAPFRYGCR